MPETTLGLSSLDHLRELKEVSERRQAEGRRRVLDLPIGEIRPDPHQVRTDFVADVLSNEDHEDLEGLARNIAAIGIHNPIHVRADAEGGYVIISGERRWRAAAIAGLETVPCLVAGEGDVDARRNTLTQLSENLQRSNLKLLDIAQALKRCLDESGLSQAELAKELGKSKSWVSKYLGLLRAEGPFQAALEEGHLGNPETARMFGRLGVAQQEKLLRRARKDDQPISHAEVAKLDRRQAGRPAPPPPECPPEPGDQHAPRVEDAPQPATPHVVRLSSVQLRRLIERLGGTAGEDAELVQDLLRLLSTSAGD
jgi:ParB family chromosome partitioning protein